MAFLEIEKLAKSFGDHQVVQPVDLAIQRGEFVSFLGPSGCGKTTTLRMMAGFEEPTSGAIRIGDKDVTRLKPNERNVGMVFQSYALFPNMTVAQNVGFGLKVAKKPAALAIIAFIVTWACMGLINIVGRTPAAAGRAKA